MQQQQKLTFKERLNYEGLFLVVKGSYAER